MAGPWEKYQNIHGPRREYAAPKADGPWLKYATPQEDAGDGQGFLGFLNQGIASVLGAPVDLVNAGLGLAGVPVSSEPFGGATSISRGLSSVGARVSEPGARPETIPEYIGMGLGGAAGALLPGVGIVGAATRAASPIAQGAARTVARPFVATPGRALGVEAASGAGAGLGMSVANQIATDNPYAEMAGAIAGGGIAGLGPNLAIRGARALPGVQMAEGLVAGQIAPFTEAGAMSRARGRIAGLVEDASAARASLNEPTISELSPAVSTGDRRLMALEQSVRDANAPVDLSMRHAETRAASALRDTSSDVAGDVPVAATREALAGRVDSIAKRMQDRTAQAVRRAQERVAQIEPGQRQMQSSTIMRDELDAAYHAARAEERAAWASVPGDAKVQTSGGKQAYQRILNQTPRAQRDSIPEKARLFLHKGSNQAFGDTETVLEVHGLYSDLRERARIARAEGKHNEARISGILADALLDDLGATAGAQGPLRQALDFSRELNQTFNQGTVGRILGSQRTGGQTVAPELTLETSIGRGGPRGAVAVDELSRATGNEISPAIPDYLRSQFMDSAVRDGSLSPGQAQSFLTRNRDMLDRVPTVRDQITGALADTNIATDTERRMAGLLRRVDQSAAARIARSPEGQELQTIFRAQDPVQTARQAVKQAGKASSGLKNAVVADLMSKARQSLFDEAGEAVISGRKILSQMRDPKYQGVMSEIMTPVEMARMEKIASEFARLETMQGKLPGVGPIMGDQPNSIVAYLARVMAARSGAAMGAGTSGASLQTASLASNRMQRILQRLTNDKAEQLIIKAVSGDKELFDALLQPTSQISKTHERRLIEAMAGMSGATAASAAPKLRGDQ